MEELKNIVLKKGDIATIKYRDGKIDKLEIKSSIRGTLIAGCVLKIERPKYDTIYEAPKKILDKEEKEYLEAVIRPFRDRVIYVSKSSDPIGEFIQIKINNDFCALPYFKAGTMYKGMELYKEYTLKELGLFEGE